MGEMTSVERLTAVHDISFVIHEYARLVDLNGGDEQVLCFAEDGVANYFGTEIVGRDAIRDLIKPAVKKWDAMTTAISNIQVEITGEASAVSMCYAHIWERNEDGDVIVRGQYHDEWVKTAEGWKIQKRTFLVMGATPPRPDAPSIGRLSL